MTDTVAAGVARVSMWAVGDSQIHPKSFGKICHLASGEEGSRESKGLFVSSLSRRILSEPAQTKYHCKCEGAKKRVNLLEIGAKGRTELKRHDFTSAARVSIPTRASRTRPATICVRRRGAHPPRVRERGRSFRDSRYVAPRSTRRSPSGACFNFGDACHDEGKSLTNNGRIGVRCSLATACFPIASGGCSGHE